MKTKGRTAKVRYWQRKGGGFFTTKNGEQIELALGPNDWPDGPTYLKALKKFHELDALVKNVGTDEYLVSALFTQYRDHLASTRVASPPQWSSVYRDFVALNGSLKVSDLRPYHVETFINSQDTWKETSRHAAGTLILGAVGWCKRKGYIKTDPLKGNVKLPRPLVRGKDARMSAELMDTLDAAIEGRTSTAAFKNFLWMLRETGARPVEVRNAIARNYKDGKIVFHWNEKNGYIHKTAKTKKDRVIYLSGALREHVEKRVKEVGDDKNASLFPSARGLVWSSHGLVNRWLRLKKTDAVRCYLAKHQLDWSELRLYNYRHTFISDFLDNVSDIYACAQICGTSVKMIEKTYGHPGHDVIASKYDSFISSRNHGLMPIK